MVAQWRPESDGFRPSRPPPFSLLCVPASWKPVQFSRFRMCCQRGRGLPQTIDSLEEPGGRRRGRKLLILLALIVGFLFAGQAALSSWVNLLWFRSLGYADVFWTTLRLEWVAFLVFVVVTFLIMAAAFAALKRAYQGYLPSDHKIILGGQPLSLPVDLVLRILSLGVSFVFAIGAGVTMASDWPVLAMFWYAQPVPGSISDPIFGKPLNFFL